MKRHARKGKRWIYRKYFTTLAGDNWRFHCIVKDKDGNKKPLYLKQASDTRIKHHIKIKAEANPFDPSFKDYFKKREMDKKIKLPNSYCNCRAEVNQPYEGLSGVLGN